MLTVDLAERAAKIRLLMTDVDGVMTDGGIYVSSSGERFLRFDAKDGMGIALLRRAGVVVAIVTCGANPAVELRAKMLGIEDVVMACPDDGKGEVVRGLMGKHGVTRDEAAFIGDDINDLPAFREVGLTIAPADAVRAVREAADWVTEAPGGHGAMREVADTILAGK